MSPEVLDGVTVDQVGRSWVVRVDGRLAGWVRVVDPPDQPVLYSSLSRAASRRSPRHRDDLPVFDTLASALADIVIAFDGSGGRLRPGLRG